MKTQLSDIKRLKESIDQNFCIKEVMQKELDILTQKTIEIISSISKRIKHREQKELLEIIVKNYLL